LLDPYEEFIKFKRHPFVADIIKGGKILEQGARTVSTGGYLSVPQLAVDGGLFVGGCAAMQNPPGLKGIHLAMKSGMLAAEAILAAMEKQSFRRGDLSLYPERFEKSWAGTEMYEGRNFAQALAKKGIMKLIHLGAQYVTHGRGIIDRMSIEEDSATLRPTGAGVRQPLEQKTYDGVLYVDKLTGVYLAKTKHREDQPCHLIVHDSDVCIDQCYPQYRSPCTRFCPANVYEIEPDEATAALRLKVNFSNCLHCKTCDVKDPYHNITWTCPEGGEGPSYTIV